MSTTVLQDYLTYSYHNRDKGSEYVLEKNPTLPATKTNFKEASYLRNAQQFLVTLLTNVYVGGKLLHLFQPPEYPPEDTRGREATKFPAEWRPLTWHFRPPPPPPQPRPFAPPPHPPSLPLTVEAEVAVEIKTVVTLP